MSIFQVDDVRFRAVHHLSYETGKGIRHFFKSDGGIRLSGGFGSGIAIKFTCEERIEVSFRLVPETS